MFKPGEEVPASGIYAVDHGPHRLMHTATLLAESRFPRCGRCGNHVRFTLLRAVKDSEVIPFRSTFFLEEYAECGSIPQAA